MSGVFIQILMTRTLDSVTGSNLKRWLQRDNLIRSQVAQATMQAQAEQNLLKITSCCSGRHKLEIFEIALVRSGP